MGVGKCWNEINDPASFAYGELRRDIINVVIILIIGSAMLSRGWTLSERSEVSRK